MSKTLVLLMTLVIVVGLVACNTATEEPPPAEAEVTEAEPVEEEAEPTEEAVEPTEEPTDEPTEVPTEEPTEEPTATLTAEPTATVASTPTAPAIDPESNFPVGKLVWTVNEEMWFIFQESGRWYHWSSEGSGPDIQECSGRFMVEGDIWSQLSNCAMCGTVPMSYRFTFDGTNLTFEPTDQSINDDCPSRKEFLSGQTYVLSED